MLSHGLRVQIKLLYGTEQKNVHACFSIIVGFHDTRLLHNESNFSSTVLTSVFACIIVSTRPINLDFQDSLLLPLQGEPCL